MKKRLVIWFTGLSGSGKSTLANAISERLSEMNHKTYILDGDLIRLGLSKDLGYSDIDRTENVRRIAEVSKLFMDAGFITIVAFISPFKRDREKAKEIIGSESFFEVYCSAPLEACEKRDVKKLYAKARKGLITNFTGISSAYEIPEYPDIIIDSTDTGLKDSVNLVLEKLTKKDRLL